MILIISEEMDLTANYVEDWLLMFKITYYKCNYNKFSFLNLEINEKKIEINIKDHDIYNIKKIWHRRSKFNFKFTTNYENLNKYLKTDEKILIDIIEKQFNFFLEYIGSYKKEVENNKLEVLITAKNNNINIPNTFITSSKIELQRFYNNCRNIITKDLYQPVWFKIKGTQYSSVGTIQITQKMIDKCNDYFIPMFLQEKTEKIYEVRIFHYKNKLFSMAIFSQNDKKTAVDYRNYNNEKPNRNVPILLPKNLENKIFNLLKDLELNTCSIDFIVNKKGEYVFLEVNPMGQLDWVSKNCNYYIEKFIAEDLMA